MVTPKGRVLLTGANGFLATHIVAGLISQNYSIVGTVRSPAKAHAIIALHPDWEPHITWTTIADISAPHAFDAVFRTAGPFDYVIHTASPVDFSVTDLQRDMIDPAVRGTTSLLAAAHALAGPSLKRIVLTGSTASISDPAQPDSTPRPTPWSESDWCPITPAHALKHNDVVAAYLASKTAAERAAWAFMDSAAPAFDITVLNPYVIMGPMLHAVPTAAHVPSTVAFPVWNFLNGSYAAMQGLVFPAWYFVDVRDVARAHILSLTTAAASNKRIILVGGLLTPQLVVNAIRANFPELRDRVVEGVPGKILPEGVEPMGWDTRRSFEVFGEGWGYRGLEETVVDTVRDLLAREAGWKV